ncbi:hypothetical protein F2P44_16470 [Massilia sp. CCM 8695]|uniref:Uncharacterized protein n=1 Tax=Massilia frigida TaxID=2609281 RepID=A0ABX0NE86_9BURK|nr:hypothetical protein [Massilia frigida]NHZ80856.1 hypothetical protein [Massilia frigida]
MKRNLLLAVKKNTAPISNKEFDEFLLRQHGTLSKENASADPGALDRVGADALKLKEKGAPQSTANHVGKDLTRSKPRQVSDQTVILSKTDVLNKTDTLSLRSKKKVADT